MTAFATQNRHLNIHSWFLMHYDKGTVQPKIRNNIMFIFVYPIKPKLLERIFDEYIDFEDDFEEFEDFKNFWRQYVKPQRYGVLLIRGKPNPKYNPNVSKWFSQK